MAQQAQNVLQLLQNEEEINHLPKPFGCLKLSDETLDLPNNALTHLPDSICQLSHLKKLDVSSNRLTKLPEDIGKLVCILP